MNFVTTVFVLCCSMSNSGVTKKVNKNVTPVSSCQWRALADVRNKKEFPSSVLVKIPKIMFLHNHVQQVTLSMKSLHFSSIAFMSSLYYVC